MISQDDCIVYTVTENMKKILLILTLVSLTACSSGSTAGTASPTASASSDESVFQYFDTVEDYQGEFIPPLNTTIRLTMDTQAELDEVYEGTADIITSYHTLLDAYHYYRNNEGTIMMNLAQVNEYLSAQSSVQVSDEMIAALQEAVAMMKLSDGYFNPFLGELINVWGNRFSSFPVEGTDPERADIDAALGCIITPETVDEQFIIDEETNTLTLNTSAECQNHLSINLGAFAKGYIQDICKQYIDSFGYNYILNFGSSNIAVLSDDPIRVGVRSPYNRALSIYAIGLESGLSLSTSGDDSNYFLLKNDDGSTTVRSHILNPETGYSENYYRNVTVITESAAICDVLSTALFNVNDADEIHSIVSSFEEAYDTDISYGLLKEDSAEEETCHLSVSESFIPYILEDYTAANITAIETE